MPAPVLASGPVAEANRREIGIDLLRIVATLAVVLIHVHLELVPDVALQPWLRAPARFVVPTFFALSGYFLPRRDGLPDGAARRIPRLVRIYVLAWLLFLPFALMQQHAPSLLQLLVGGTWFHLWFLPALIFGLAATEAIVRLPGARWWFWTLSVGVLVALVWCDAVLQMHGRGDEQARQAVVAFRFLQAMPMIWIGFGLARANLGLRAGLAIFLGGCAVLAAQMAWFASLGIVAADPEYPASALPMTIGLIVIARHLSAPLTARPRLAKKLTQAGARWSLPVYLLHPAAIVILDRLCLLLHWPSALMVYAEIALLGPAMLVGFCLLDRYLPWLVDIMGGSWRTPRRT